MDNFYKEGRGFLEAEDFESAISLFKKGAEEGDPKCVYGLIATAATKGEDPSDYFQALQTALPKLQKLADGGDGEACFMLGRCLESGAGTAPDIDLALEHYKKAANVGNTDAMFNLGCFYIHTCMSEDEVFTKYFLPSAALGNKNACLAVAFRYENMGLLTDADYWYTRAVANGAPSAIHAREEYFKRKNKT